MTQLCVEVCASRSHGCSIPADSRKPSDPVSSLVPTTPNWVGCNHNGACPIPYECDRKTERLDIQRPTASGNRGPCVSDAAISKLRVAASCLCLSALLAGLHVSLLASQLAYELTCPDLHQALSRNGKGKRGASRLTGWFQNCDHHPSWCRSLDLRLSSTRTFTSHPPPYFQGQARLTASTASSNTRRSCLGACRLARLQR